MKMTRRLATVLRKAASYLNPVFSTVGGWVTVFETSTGSWQQNVITESTTATVSANWAVFSCVTLIAGDIAKMPARVMQYNKALRVWEQTERRKVLKKPNRYQTRIEFMQNWVQSMLLFGNAYVMKQRDDQGRIVALYVLDPSRVQPLVSSDGGVYYELQDDNLAQLVERVVVPSSEMIHDRINTLWHPLIGVSPIYASGNAALQGLYIQENSSNFFKNRSTPGGMLTAPGAIPKETAERIRTQWQENYSGANAGKVAVLSDGLEYKSIGVTASDAQLLEQLRFTGEMVCATFHVPPYKLGLGAMPTVNNVAALNQQYYDQALQPLVENIELRMDEGLELGEGFETWLDETVLVRMDPSTRLEAHNKAVGGGWKSPDEVRREENLPPVEGGATPYLQQQNYSLAALAKRDAGDDPFSKGSPAPAADPSARESATDPATDPPTDPAAEERAYVDAIDLKLEQRRMAA
jgi:HK97 family phage portal protein